LELDGTEIGAKGSVIKQWPLWDLARLHLDSFGLWAAGVWDRVGKNITDEQRECVAAWILNRR
jgi:hypothetical protein